MQTIKMIHFADYHLGVDTHGPQDPETRLNGRVLDFLDSLDALIDYAVTEDADLVVFAGDAFHKHSPEPTLMDLFGERITRLADQCPVVLLIGNHDLSSMDKASSIDIFNTLRVSNVIVGWDYEVHKIQTKHGMIQVATAPFPLKGQFLSPNEIRRKNAGQLFKERLANAIQELANSIDTDFPAVLTGHFSVNSAMYGSERAMYIGNDAEVDVQTLVDDVWDYVALGHIHYHQCLNEIIPDLESYAPIVYAGSLDRVDFTEENDDKGFIWVEIGEEVKWEQVLVDARPFITIKVTVNENDKASKKILSEIRKAELKDAVVRLQISITDGMEARIDRQRVIEEVEKSGAYFLHSFITKVAQKQARARLDDDINASSMSHIDLVDLWLQHDGKTNDEIDELLDLAEEIMYDAYN